MRNKYPELSDIEWANKITIKKIKAMVDEEYSSAQAKANMVNKEYEGVPYIKYADSELPVLGRYFPPVGHKHYHKPFSEAMADCVKRGLIYQGRLWDAYDKCSMDVSVSLRRKPYGRP